MPAQPTSELNIVMGAMTFGAEGKEQARVHDIEEVNKILDIFQAHGHKEIDTARVYCGGTSEEYLAKAKWQERGLVMDTKLYPNPNMMPGVDKITHTPEVDLRKHLNISLKALGATKIDMWYLHGPDRSTPYEVTMKAVNDLYKEGLFERFGISNYMSWEVAKIMEICIANGYVKPYAYQACGVYNAVHRNAEPELFPCLRHYNIAFYAFNPLGGGFFTGAFKKDGEVEAGSRFDPNKWQGKSYRARYWNDKYFEAMEIIRPVAEKHNLTMAEVALRWMSHHSLLKRKYNDAVLIGASSTKHIEQNLIDFEKGPLPEEVVKALDAAWEHVRPIAAKYHH
ncbi:Aldo/keto reductase [Exidia glandulosa HHB12029]|uniref:Aldo/keto reductase n=1 Tax=Exidia glandulosa HHB12029 TaxID=1314781 RepID=A0A165MH00_EXIGL|nr:Aldo/keto reductase [Exidia glandulosa HHB12029]